MHAAFPALESVPWYFHWSKASVNKMQATKAKPVTMHVRQLVWDQRVLDSKLTQQYSTTESINQEHGRQYGDGGYCCV